MIKQIILLIATISLLAIAMTILFGLQAAIIFAPIAGVCFGIWTYLIGKYSADK
jgi:hypothetical protein